MAIGKLVYCKISNNGVVPWVWQRWFKKTDSFLFKKKYYYTMVKQDGFIYVITKDHAPIKIDHSSFSLLFKVI